MGELTVLVTGASGFLGRHSVAGLRCRGRSVVALVRQLGNVPPDWHEDPGIRIVVSELVSPSDELRDICSGCQAVVHCAALMSGSDQDHAAATLPMTEQIAQMMPTGAHFVLVSSLAVYDASSLMEKAVLDESSPLEADGLGRDAYCRAKLAQERIARQIADERGLVLSILRPGVIFGPGRLWNAHLGLALGPALLRVGAQGQIPLSYVEHTAKALAQALELPEGCGEVNVVDDDLPERADFVTALKKSGWPRVVVPVPYKLFAALAPIVGLLPHAPGLFQRKTLEARLRPMRYSNTRLHDRLGWEPRCSFEQAVNHSIERDNL